MCDGAVVGVCMRVGGEGCERVVSGGHKMRGGLIVVHKVQVCSAVLYPPRAPSQLSPP